MNQVKVSLFALAMIAAICFVAQVVEAQKKDDIIVVGGEKGCGPKMVLKTSAKGKGQDILLMNPCKKKEYEHVPYPEYHHEYDSHSYGGDMGYGGDDDGYHGGEHEHGGY